MRPPDQTNLEMEVQTMTGDDPIHLVEFGVARILERASTWLAWDGVPRLSQDGTRLPNGPSLAAASAVGYEDREVG
jgi:hypothetical protein